MIAFTPLTISHAATLRTYTMQSSCMNCDMNVANLCSWQFLYHTEYAIKEGFLLLRFLINGQITYMMPIGKGDLRHVLMQLQADAHCMGDSFRLACVCPCAQKYIEEAFPGTFQFSSNRDSADYIYLRESLASLSGKKLQPKRNHISKFKRLYPNYVYRPLSPELVTECLRVAEQWYISNDYHKQSSMKAELQMMRTALAHMDELQIIGGTLFVDEQMIAFTFGAYINQETFDVCVEKADTSYEGAYAMINHLFVCQLPENIKYVNREEDLGIEGLRKAKLSYQPALILDKMTGSAIVVPETDMERDIRLETRRLWEHSFTDSQAFVNLYFSKKFQAKRNETLIREQHVVAALQRLPYPMTYGDRLIAASYISGACTEENYRRRGLMSELLLQAHRSMHTEGSLFSFLIPATPELFDYYAKFGYTPCFRYSQKTIQIDYTKETDNSITIAPSKFPPLGYIRTMMQQRPMCIQHPISDLEIVIEDCSLGNDTIWEATLGNTTKAVAICRTSPKGVCLREYVYDDEASFKALVTGIAAHYGQTQIDIIDIKADKGNYLGMARIIHAKAMLEAHAALHPDKDLWIYLTDPAIPSNDGSYHITKGECIFLPERLPQTKEYSIATLSHTILTEENPLMTLMMND